MIFYPLQQKLSHTEALERAHLYKANISGHCLSVNDRTKGTYIIGKPGTGKTTLLQWLILQDIYAGFGVCFIDVHGDATKEIIKRIPGSRLDDVILVDYKDCRDFPIGLNAFECPDAKDRYKVSLTLKFVTHIFERAFGVTADRPLVSQYLRNVALTLIANPGMGLADIPLLFDSAEFRDRLLANVTNTEVLRFWRNFNQLKATDQLDKASFIVNKVGMFIDDEHTRAIFGQSRSTLDFRYIMDERKILIINVPEGPALNMMGTVVVARILDAAFSRGDIPEKKRMPFFIYLDEFQNLEGIDDIAQLIAEARKYRIAVLVSHQLRTQLSRINKAATVGAANIIVTRVSGDDAAKELAQEFDRTPRKVPGEKRREQVRLPVAELIQWVNNNHPHTSSILGEQHKSLVTDFCKAVQYIIDISHERVVDGVPTVPYLGRAEIRQAAGQVVTIDDLMPSVGAYNTQRYSHGSYPIEHPGDGNRHSVENATRFIKALNRLFHRVMTTKTTDIPFEFEAWFHKDVSSQEEKSIVLFGKPHVYGDVLAHIEMVKKALVADPVLVPSGQYEEVATERVLSTAETEAQIANELLTLEDHYAKAMFSGKQADISINKLSAGRSEEAFRRVLAVIQANTRTRYARPYKEVEEEINRRQFLKMPHMQEKQDSITPGPSDLETFLQDKRYKRRAN